MTSRTESAPNEKEVDRAHKAFLLFVGQARQLNPVDCEALINRLRVDVMTNDFSRARKGLYRAAGDYFEDILDERLSKHSQSRADTKGAVRRYIARLLEADD